MMTMMALALVAAPFEDLDAIDRQASAAAAAIGRTAQPVDRRLHLARCENGAVVEAAGADALAVRCAAAGWRLRVRLTDERGATGSVKALAAVPVLRRGEPVTIRATGSGFVVETVGIASDDGALGATIRARIDDGKAGQAGKAGGAMISGVVTGPREITTGPLNPGDDVSLRGGVPDRATHGAEERER